MPGAAAAVMHGASRGSHVLVAVVPIAAALWLLAIVAVALAVLAFAWIYR